MRQSDSSCSLSQPPASLAAGSTGYIHSIENGGFVDGPGIRFVVFFSGCPLRCQYCHNPDTWAMQDGTLTEAQALLAKIAGAAGFLRRGGGVTFSGGEPLMQPDFLLALLHGCKQLGLHTALDTSGQLGERALDELLALTDLVLLDIKSFHPQTYKDVTGAELRPVLQFAERLAAVRKPVWLRFVLVPGLTDSLSNIAELAAFARGLGNVAAVEVLPFHQLGQYKWQFAGLPYRLGAVRPPSQAELAAAQRLFTEHGLTVR